MAKIDLTNDSGVGYTTKLNECRIFTRARHVRANVEAIPKLIVVADQPFAPGLLDVTQFGDEQRRIEPALAQGVADEVRKLQDGTLRCGCGQPAVAITRGGVACVDHHAKRVTGRR